MGKVPTDAIVLQKLIMDVVYTMKIQQWIQIAIEKKRIDKIHYTNKQNELKHWYHHLNSDLFKYEQSKDDYHNLIFKIEQETIEFKK